MNLGEAAKWFRKAAEQNIPEDRFNLALYYEEGESVPKDFGEQ
jgi:TPR repeat protein